MLIPGNDLQTALESRLIPLSEIKRFQILQGTVRGVLMVKLIVHQRVVGLNPIHCRWVEVFHVKLGLKINVSVPIGSAQ